jgi:hypothetical protein
MYKYLIIKTIHLILEKFGEMISDPFQKSLAKVR